MDYPISQAIIDHVISGLRQNEARIDGIEARVADAIEKLPADKRADLTTESVFASTVSGVKLSGELATMVRNPAFKVEPAISQLRRAEAAYIETHDAYLKNRASSTAIEEMRWAFHRLTIARACFDGIIKSLPPHMREAVVERPTATKSIAVEQLCWDAFSDEEQQAIRLIHDDREAAIERIDRIIVAGQATRQFRILQSYLVDPACRAEIERWLEREIGTGRMSHSASIAAPAPTSVSPLSPDRPASQPVRSADIPTAPARHDVNDVAIEMLERWLDQYPNFLVQFVRSDGRWRFNDQIRAPRYAAAYAQVADHPRFQAMIDRQKRTAT